jgi:hypothetical protein
MGLSFLIETMLLVLVLAVPGMGLSFLIETMLFLVVLLGSQSVIFYY